MSSYVDCGCEILCYAICGELYTVCYRADSQEKCFISRTFFCIPRPDDGNPTLLTSYRSELGGLVTLLYIIHRICQYYNLETGHVTIYCDNISALHSTFHWTEQSITPFYTADYDLIHLAKYLLQLLPITAIGTWVNGHYGGKING